MSTPAANSGPYSAERRIGDVERELAARQIVAAVGSGHLTVDEADQRTQRIYEARWPSDLALLLNDLPAAQQPAPAPQSPVREGPPHSGPRNRIPFVPALLIVIGAILLVNEIAHVFLFPLVPLLIGIFLLTKWHRSRTLHRP